MAISFVAVASFNPGAVGTSIVVPKPTGTVQNDVMIAVLRWAATVTNLTPPSGWTLLFDHTATGSVVFMAAYFKLAGPSEPADYTWTHTESRFRQAAILSYRGGQPDDPIDASANVLDTAAPFEAPSVTTTRPKDLVLVVLGNGQIASQVSPPTGHTERYEASITGQADSLLQISDKEFAAVGATGTAEPIGATETTRFYRVALKAQDAVGRSRLALVVV